MFCDVNIFVDLMLRVLHEMNELPELLKTFSCYCFYFSKCPPLTLRNARDSYMLIDYFVIQQVRLNL